jgi:phospholipase C
VQRRRLSISDQRIFASNGQYAAVPNANNDSNTATPIQHVIIVIGENRAFDHIYRTYTTKSGDKILNLLSEGIVGADGSLGPHFVRAQQFTTSAQTSYFISVPKAGKTAYKTLPAPTLNGAPNTASATAPPFTGLPDMLLAALEPSLEPADLFLLTTGATGAAGPDLRITNDSSLPNGPFQLTGPNLSYGS